MQGNVSDVDEFDCTLWEGGGRSFDREDLEAHAAKLLSTYGRDIDIRIRHLQARMRGSLVRLGTGLRRTEEAKGGALNDQLHSNNPATPQPVKERNRTSLASRIGLGCSVDPLKGPRLRYACFMREAASELPPGWSVDLELAEESRFCHDDGRQSRLHPYHDDSTLVFGSELDLTTEFLRQMKQAPTSSAAQLDHTYLTLALRNACYRSLTPEYPDNCWIEQPTYEQGASLCSICAHIDFHGLWTDHSLRGRLLFQSLLSWESRENDCVFCQLLWRAASSVVSEDWLRAASTADVVVRQRFVVYTPKPSISFIGETVFYLGKQILGKVQIVGSVPRDGASAWFLPGLGLHAYHAASDTVDAGLIRRWLQDSDRHADLQPVSSTGDGKTEVRSSHHSRPETFTVLDVENECLVDIAPWAEYVALSYVWGGPQPLMNTKKTKAGLYCRGSLGKRAQVPATIRDSLLFLRSLGERYLWIDSLCIVQDDEADKFEKIYNMDQIYARARFTLVAAYGDSCHAGLPGVAVGSRVSPWNHIQGIQVSIEPLDFEQVIRSTVWIRRGWTFQEWQLSTRCIIFTANEVFLRNGSVMARECATVPPRVADISPAVFENVDRSLGVFEYAGMLSTYTSRMLSSSTDKLNAFRGIERLLQPHMRSAFLWGLPKEVLDNAILWRPSCLTAERLPQFPSWSWCGWEGPMVLSSFALSDNVCRVQWQDAVTKTFFVRNTARTDHDLRLQRDTAIFHQGLPVGQPSVERQSDGNCLDDSEKSLPKNMLLLDDEKVLRFKALVVTMRLKNFEGIPHDIGAEEDARWMYVVGSDGFDAGSLRLDVDNFGCGDGICPRVDLICLSRCYSDAISTYGKPQPERPATQIAGEISADWKEVPGHAELYPRQSYEAAIASDRLPEPDRYAPEGYDRCRYNAYIPYALYNVLLIVRRSDGIAERRGVGVVHITAFWQAEPKWQLVELG